MNELSPDLYEQLRGIAGRFMRGERGSHTLQPTALVNEAWLKLARQQSEAFEGLTHYRAVAARAMRQILVDHARARATAKRGGGHRRVTILNADGASEAGVDLVELNDALEALARADARQARIVELRFFGGLSIDETAEVLELSRRTVLAEWRVARSWLGAELEA